MVKRVLLVEDDESFQNLLSSILDTMGFTLAIARDGLEALNYLTENTVDLIILNLKMPHMSGPDVLERLIWNKRLAKIPILINTSLNDDTSYAQNLLSLYKNKLQISWLTRPHTPTEFRNRVNQLVWPRKPSPRRKPGSRS